MATAKDSFPKWLEDYLDIQSQTYLELINLSKQFHSNQELITHDQKQYKEPIIMRIMEAKTDQIQNYIDYLNQLLADITIDPDDRVLYETQLELLSDSVTEKTKRYQMDNLRFDGNLARGSIFGNRTPQTGSPSYQEMTDDGGHLVLERNGYAKKSVRNSNGVMLTPYDAFILAGVQEMWRIKGCEIAFSFTYRELLELVGKRNSGEFPVMLQSLDNIWNTEIVLYEFYDPEEQRHYTTEKHRVIQSMKDNPHDYTIHIMLSTYMHKTLTSGFTIGFNQNLFNDLNSSVSQLLYLFLKTYVNTSVRSFDINLLSDHLNLYNSKTKNTQLLQEGFEELKKRGFIKNFVFTKSGRFYKSVLFEFGEKREENLLL